MRRLLALCTLLVTAVSAPAHFIWLVPGAGGASDTLRMVFSDTLEPDEGVPIAKVAQTKLFARAGADGAAVPVQMTTEKHSIRVTLKAATGPVVVGGVYRYGVLARGKGQPFLLMYYPKTLVPGSDSKLTAWVAKGSSQLPFEIVPAGGKRGQFRVLWQGKPADGAEVTLQVPGLDDQEDQKTKADGLFTVPAASRSGVLAIRAKYVEKKAGALDGKKYAEVRHYATFTMPVGKTAASGARSRTSSEAQPAPNPAATKLLADARAARAVWRDFPGFRADVVVNDNGKTSKGTLEVTPKGKVSLRLEGASDETRTWARRELISLVAHRLPGGPSDTPCAFADEVAHHPQGRLIRILNDELHSVYRIRGREIIEVHRRMKDVRFTISVLENVWNNEKQCLPACYVVNSWDLKKDALVNATAHHNTWRRVGSYDLPASLLVVNATPARLGSRSIAFTNVRLNDTAASATSARRP